MGLKELFLHVYLIMIFGLGVSFNLLIVMFTKRNWYNRIKGTNIFLGGIPHFLFPFPKKYYCVENGDEGEDKEKVGKVTGILCLCYWYETLMMLNIWGRDKTVKKIPIMDHYGTTSMENVMDGVKFIEEIVEKDNFIYVHCKGGKGRSTMLVCAYLMYKRKISAEDAVAYVRQFRPQINVKGIKFRTLKKWRNYIDKDISNEIKEKTTVVEIIQ